MRFPACPARGSLRRAGVTFGTGPNAGLRAERLEAEEEFLHAVAQQPAALDRVARHATREILGRIARRGPLGPWRSLVDEPLIVERHETPRLLRHRAHG